MELKTVDSYNFNNQKALIRVDFNVPLNKTTFAITDDSRMTAALPTINKIVNDGGTVIIMSHLGRPKGGYEDKYSLKHLVAHLSELLNKPVKFATDCIGDATIQLVKSLQQGDVLLLENLRFHPEEEKGGEAFAKHLAAYGDVYVNDAFGTAHRAHASTTIVAKFFTADKKMFGYLMAVEVENAERVLKSNEHPFTAIIGGAKVSDKILILSQLVNVADNILIGGGMAYTFFKALGGNIGNSLCEDDKLDMAREILDTAHKKNVTIVLPADSITADKFSNDAKTGTCESMSITTGYMALDIGPKAIAEFSKVIASSKKILWNGPMGVFEMSNFENGTKQVAQAVAAATKGGAYSLIGGGDSAAAIYKFGLSKQVSYVSTGGGALLEYFEGKTLPGVAAIIE